MYKLIKDVTLFEDYLDIWAITTTLNNHLDDGIENNLKNNYDVSVISGDISTEYLIKIRRKHLLALQDIIPKEEKSDWITLYKSKVFGDKIIIDTLLEGNWIFEFLNLG